jgi:hypothetical protein
MFRGIAFREDNWLMIPKSYEGKADSNDCKRNSDCVAADYSGASRSTVWNMFLYVDLAEHRMHRDDVS